MLRNLRIKNIALIDTIELSFSSGFTAITGETGSGKSILLNSLHLILGERADFSIIGSNGDKSIVEADFCLTGYSLNSFFSENDLDYQDETLIRREITRSGKSRAFINDTPVSLTILKNLTSQLISINSQFNSLQLKSKSYQLDILDLLAGLETLKKKYTSIYDEYQSIQSRLEVTRNQYNESLKQKDYNDFQLRELEELNLNSRSFNVLSDELKLAENSEVILETLHQLTRALDGEKGVLESIGFVKNTLQKIHTFDTRYNEILDRINSVSIEMRDILSEINSASERVDIQPEKISFLQELLDKYNRALRKHNLNDQEQLLALEERLKSETENTESFMHLIAALEREEEDQKARLIDLANELHVKRKEASVVIAKDLSELLLELKLPQTKLLFELRLNEIPDRNGLTAIDLLFSANKGMLPVPIEKAASGGELSRLMLALQKMFSDKKQLPTLLFDEIDTGVSGEVAEKMGMLMQKMGANFQLMAITHLPQVAAKANHHLKVEKRIVNQKSMTFVEALKDAEKAEEIARLISGEKITDAARMAARDLMN